MSKLTEDLKSKGIKPDKDIDDRLANFGELVIGGKLYMATSQAKAKAAATTSSATELAEAPDAEAITTEEGEQQ